MNCSKASRPFIIALSFSLLFITLAVFLVPGLTVQALDSVTIYYVATSCAGVPAPCFTSIQAAVDAVDEPTDSIKVAAGTYTDVHARPRHDISTTGVVTQVVYISKSLTIRGGYTLTNWTTPDPEANPTTLDAQSKGRVIYVTGNISPTIEGLRLTDGNAAGLLGALGYDTGGGVYAITASLTLSHTDIFSNVVSKWYAGGGVSISRGQADLLGNSFEANANSGLALDHSTATIANNVFAGSGQAGLYSEYSTVTVQSNIFTANFYGVWLFRGAAIIETNQIISNTSTALSVGESSIFIDNNFIANNDEGIGVGVSTGEIRGNTILRNRRGIDIDKSPAMTVSHNFILANAGLGNGGGIHLHGNRGTPGTVVSSNWIEGNGGFAGGGLSLDFSDVSLYGNTIISNTALQSSGGGIYATDHSRLALVNNVIAGNTISATGSGAGLYLLNSSADLNHNTIAQNHGGDGSGLFLAASDGHSYNITLTNSIVASHTVGITTSTTGTALTARLNHTLWSGNSVNWAGSGITNAQDYAGDPAFINPNAGNYHIGPGSAAIDRGIRTNVFFDIDGEPRVNTPDLGADEYWVPSALKQVFLPIVFKP